VNAPLVYPKLTREQLAARWNELATTPGLPEKFELDEYGEIVELIAPKLPHQRLVRAVSVQLEMQLGGEALPGVNVSTNFGVRIPDVAWRKEWPSTNEDPLPTAPTICVEVLSESNTRREIDGKTAAYLEAGAQEVILIETSGRIRYFGADGERAQSAFGLTLTLPADTYPR
jgi:Uma2 family endonuclease